MGILFPVFLYIVCIYSVDTRYNRGKKRKKVIIFRGKAHILFNLSLTYLLDRWLGLDIGFYMYSGIALGSILPDTDCRYGTGSMFIPLWVPLEIIARIFKRKDIKAKAKRYHKSFKEAARMYYHRTWTHSIFFIAFLYGFYRVYPGEGIKGILIGVTGHILLDSFTRSGIMIFYPVIKKNYGAKLFYASDKNINDAISGLSLYVVVMSTIFL